MAFKPLPAAVRYHPGIPTQQYWRACFATAPSLFMNYVAFQREHCALCRPGVSRTMHFGATKLAGSQGCFRTAAQVIPVQKRLALSQVALATWQQWPTL